MLEVYWLNTIKCSFIKLSALAKQTIVCEIILRFTYFLLHFSQDVSVYLLAL